MKELVTTIIQPNAIWGGEISTHVKEIPKGIPHARKWFLRPFILRDNGIGIMLLVIQERLFQ